MDKFEPIVKTYYDALEEGRILARKCNKCGSIMYPPMPICQECSSTDTKWTELDSNAVLVEVGSLNEHHIWPELKAYFPLRWGEVELTDGPCLTAVVLGIDNPDEVAKRLPVPVKAEIIQDDGFKTVAFRIAE